MGWSFMHRDKGMTDRDFFASEVLSPESEIVACSTKNNVFYAAVRSAQPSVGVWALVVLIQRTKGHYNFGYKVMSEDDGPVEHNAPASVLDALSPTEVQWANQWRAKARAALARQQDRPVVKPGDLVTFNHPIAFSDGEKHVSLVFLGRTTFRAGSKIYRIPRWRERTHVVSSLVAGMVV